MIRTARIKSKCLKFPIILQPLHLVGTMAVVHREGHHVPHTLHATNQHAQPIKSHTPSSVRTAARLPQIQKPLDRRYVHFSALDLLVQPVKPPLTHGPAEKLPNARAQQVEREALPASVVCLSHIEGFNLQWPVCHKDESAELLAFLDVVLPLVIRHGLIAEVLHEDLLVLTPKIIFITWKFLDLDALKLSIVSRDFSLLLHKPANEVDGVPVLDPHEWTVHTLPQHGSRRFHIRGRHTALQELEVGLAPLQRVVDYKFDESLGLAHQLVQRDESPLVLHVQELGEVLRRVGLLGPEALLTGVHLPEPTDGCLQRELAAHRQAHLQRLPSFRIGGKHERLHGESLPGPFAVAHGHNVGIRELDVLLVHEEVHSHVQLGTDAENALRRLGAKPVKGEVAQADHPLLRSLLDGVPDGIEDITNDADAGGLELEVLRGRGRREDDLAVHDDGAAGADAF
mmetsp:Transcript_44281/g.94256  ORF Transcript_44281/g.94256 Transcript_44281/m.94256 type:complete len:456 (-) Transcript_44281:501-1868(-)